MQLSVHEQQLLTLIVLGGAIALGRLLIGGGSLTVREILGQIMVGAGLATSAGAALLVFHDMSATALVGVGALIGCGGQSFLETAIRRYLGRSPSKGEAVSDADEV